MGRGGQHGDDSVAVICHITHGPSSRGSLGFQGSNGFRINIIHHQRMSLFYQILRHMRTHISWKKTENSVNQKTKHEKGKNILRT
jgi:hypothetical protein